MNFCKEDTLVNTCKEKAAVNELLTKDSIEHYNETLDSFFESWLTNEQTDDADSYERAMRYTHLQGFKKFLKMIGED